mmetsp:Transcript_27433/g.90757  ORF Transcript_27433/g.90757 Transcript_27433/m.90757 type:complete len:292 (-) Transcript_27433:75-950(-)
MSSGLSVEVGGGGARRAPGEGERARIRRRGSARCFCASPGRGTSVVGHGPARLVVVGGRRRRRRAVARVVLDPGAERAVLVLDAQEARVDAVALVHQGGLLAAERVVLLLEVLELLALALSRDARVLPVALAAHVLALLLERRRVEVLGRAGAAVGVLVGARHVGRPLALRGRLRPPLRRRLLGLGRQLARAAVRGRERGDGGGGLGELLVGTDAAQRVGRVFPADDRRLHLTAVSLVRDERQCRQQCISAVALRRVSWHCCCAAGRPRVGGHGGCRRRVHSGLAAVTRTP